MSDEPTVEEALKELVCRKCGNPKPLDGYYRSRGKIQQPCADCRSQRTIARRSQDLVRCDECDGRFTKFGLTHHKRVKHNAPPKQRLDHHGYIRVYSPRHRKEKPLHRLLVEESLGSALPPSVHVHHKNDNHQDNRLNNLEALSSDEHRAIHSSPLVTLTCPYCKQNRTVRVQVAAQLKTTTCGKCRYGHLQEIAAKPEPDAAIIAARAAHRAFKQSQAKEQPH